MNIALLYPNRTQNCTGVRNLTKGIIREVVKMDCKNHYVLSDDAYFDLDISVFSNIRWGGYEQECLRYDFMCYCNKVDIIHSYWNTFELMKNKCIKIFTIHDLIPLVHPEWHTMKDYFDGQVRRTAYMSDLILANSEYTKSDIVKYYNIAPERVKVIYPGLLHTLDFSSGNKSVLDKYGIRDEYIMSVSTIEPRKNLRGLVNGFISYKKEHPQSGLKLVLVGGIGWDKEFENDIAQIGEYRDSIILTGFVSDEELSSIYRYALAVVYVSFYEGFGLPLLEALAAGRAVISSDTTSLPEVCGEAACYCDPYDQESIANAIERVVSDNSYRSMLEAQAVAQAKKFSYEKAAEQTINIYNEFE